MIDIVTGFIGGHIDTISFCGAVQWWLWCRIGKPKKIKSIVKKP